MMTSCLRCRQSAHHHLWRHEPAQQEEDAEFSDILTPIEKNVRGFGVFALKLPSARLRNPHHHHPHHPCSSEDTHCFSLQDSSSDESFHDHEHDALEQQGASRPPTARDWINANSDDHLQVGLRSALSTSDHSWSDDIPERSVDTLEGSGSSFSQKPVRQKCQRQETFLLPVAAGKAETSRPALLPLALDLSSQSSRRLLGDCWTG
eukprot:421196-Hanusia_phi.AAC.4